MPGHSTIMRNLNKACRIAPNSDCSRAKLGCLIVTSGNKIVATGYNHFKTSPIQRKYNKYRRNSEFPPHIHNDTLHAEIDALNKCSFLDIDWSKVDVYVGRIDKLGNPRMAKPCPACLKAIRDRGVRRVYYTQNDGYGCINI